MIVKMKRIYKVQKSKLRGLVKEPYLEKLQECQHCTLSVINRGTSINTNYNIRDDYNFLASIRELSQNVKYSQESSSDFDFASIYF
jgi:hypothetical protein